MFAEGVAMLLRLDAGGGGGISIAGLSVSLNLVLPYTILAIYAAYKIIKMYVERGTVQELSDVFKEVAVFATVVGLITIFSSWPAPQGIDNMLEQAWNRTVKAQQCIANIRLSGPFAAYASYAEAKLSKYTVVYDNALWLLSQLQGMYRVLSQWGPTVLAIAFAIYAAWLRPIGGALIGVVAGAWLGLAVFSAYAPQGIQFFNITADYHPFTAIGCDDSLASLYSQDIDGWRALVAMATLTLSLSLLLGGTAGYVLGRH
ncbi:MAG: hypothetical protein QXI84_10710 [Thermofilaceae archaeon]